MAEMSKMLTDEQVAHLKTMKKSEAYEDKYLENKKKYKELKKKMRDFEKGN